MRREWEPEELVAYEQGAGRRALARSYVIKELL